MFFIPFVLFFFGYPVFAMDASSKDTPRNWLVQLQVTPISNYAQELVDNGTISSLHPLVTPPVQLWWGWQKNDWQIQHSIHYQIQTVHRTSNTDTDIQQLGAIYLSQEGYKTWKHDDIQLLLGVGWSMNIPRVTRISSLFTSAEQQDYDQQSLDTALQIYALGISMPIGIQYWIQPNCYIGVTMKNQAYFSVYNVENQRDIALYSQTQNGLVVGVAW